MVQKISAVFRGRLSRRSYLLFWFLPTLAITLLFELIPRQDGIVEEAVSWTATIVGLAVMAGDIPLGMARFRDGGLSGWWYILLGWPQLLRLILPMGLGLAADVAAMRMLRVVDVPSPSNWIASLSQPLAAYLPFLVMALLLMGWWWSVFRLVIRAGDAGPNRYGPDPLEGDVFS